MVSPRYLDDMEKRTLLVLARAAVGFRILVIEAGSLPPSMDETSWSDLEDGGRPVRDPFLGERPATSFTGGLLAISIGTPLPGRPPTSIVVAIESHAQAH
jgi:hypothetical protein